MYRQGSLFASVEVGVDPELSELTRHRLDDRSWIDFCPGWLRGADAVFDDLHATTSWRSRRVPMYDREVDEPRLHSWWRAAVNRAEPLAILGEIRSILSARYDEEFDSIGLNLYRDRHDSVAWHRDRHRTTVPRPVVAIVSVGDRRPFRIRPYGGGPSIGYELGHGDLFVMGGASQQDWEHTVPKSSYGVGPRISITFRHGAER